MESRRQRQKNEILTHSGRICAIVLFASFFCSGVSVASEDSWYAKLWTKVTRREDVRRMPVSGEAVVDSSASANPARQPTQSSAPKPTVAAPAKTGTVVAGYDGAPNSFVSQNLPKVLEGVARQTDHLRNDSRSSVANDPIPEEHILTSDGYSGPDMSEERSFADEHLHRTFPMPQAQVQQPMKNPPTIQQYAQPPQPPRRGDE